MPGKVFHVSDSVHKAVTKYCKDNRLVVKEWVESTLMRGTGMANSNLVLEAIPTKPAKKKINIIHTRPLEEDPWVKPPFWKNNG